jgi:hypothetical protein
MKRSILAILAGVAMLTVATTASAYSIDGEEIGELDTYIAGGTINSGDDSEVDWVNAALQEYYGVTFNFTTDDLTKYDTPEGAGWVKTDQYTAAAPVFAFALDTAPAFYYIKTGNVGAYDHFLFANNESMDWAVLNLLTSFGAGYEIKGIGKFSHTGELDADPVPEPGTFLLLGAGLVGLAAFGRRRSKK